MANLIGLQAGHQNITSNIDPTLATETGAPGEEAFNVAVRDQLGQYLIAYGFQVQLDDANANSSINTVGKDFAFYLAIHADSEPAGGAVSAPDPSVDAVNGDSIRICDNISSVYFKDTGIAANASIITSNMTFYYMWNFLTAKTPCGIIECGGLADPHDAVILADHRRIALGIAHGICNAFGVEWKGDPTVIPTPAPVPEPTNPCEAYIIKLQNLQAEFDTYKAKYPVVQTITPLATVPIAATSSEIPPAQPGTIGGSPVTKTSTLKAKIIAWINSL